MRGRDLRPLAACSYRSYVIIIMSHFLIKLLLLESLVCSIASTLSRRKCSSFLDVEIVYIE